MIPELGLGEAGVDGKSKGAFALAVLNNGHDEIRAVIPTDGILIINNHITLHGRTAFTDPERHLLRLRFHKPGALAG
jgi:alpha-ketoglutarate-dependent taurine dioxygenase